MNTETYQHLDVSIIFSTYNRAEQLRKTLTAMAAVNRTGIHTEIVVVDNNSTDDTKCVIESFMDSLPIRYLFEPRPGKNKALNHALNTVELGEIVVFCDDDIYPDENWLQEIVKSCDRWPQYSVFGGSIYLVWPEMTIPKWAKCRRIHGWAFTRHDDVAVQDSPYPCGGHPAGAGFWVRRSVFDNGRRYDESIGPKAGGKFFMGSETSFLFQLARDGYPAIHIPEAIVGHQVQLELLTRESIKKRAKRHGGGFYHLRPLPRQQLLKKHPYLWRLIQLLVLAKWSIYYVLASFSVSSDQRLLKQLVGIRWMAATKESFNVAKEKLSHSPTQSPEITAQFVPYWGGNPYQNQLAEYLTENGVHMNQGSSLKSAFNRYFLKGQRLNILHIHWLPAIVPPQIVSFMRVIMFMLRVEILRLCGVKVVWTVHNIQTHEGKMQSLDQWLRRRLAHMADSLITHSQAAKQQIISLWGLKNQNKIFAVPHGNYIQCYPNTVNQDEARKELNISDDTFVVLFLGGVRPYKGLPELIDALKAVDHTNVQLLIAGKSVNESFADQINNLIAGDERIRWDSGFIEDDRIQYYMAASDIAAFPYRQVFSSGAVILAMSFGRACLVPAIGTMQEVLDTSGAYFYDPETSDGLQIALHQAIENHNHLLQMGEYNLKMAEQWSWDRIARQTIEAYQWSLPGRQQTETTVSPMVNQPLTERVSS